MDLIINSYGDAIIRQKFLNLIMCILFLLNGLLGFVSGKPTENAVTLPSSSTSAQHQMTDHIVVVIDAQLYPWIRGKFTRFLNEVREWFPVNFSCIYVNGLRSRIPISPAELRGILQSEYTMNHTTGALFVGQIPVAVWKQGAGNNSGQLSVFYEDLDGTFHDTDGDGVYDYHSFGPHDGPEIWVCWMRPPVFAQALFMNHFLEKTHRYYTGGIVTEPKALIACHEDYDNNFYGSLGVVPVLQDIYGAGNVDTDGEGTDITIATEIWQQLRTNNYEVFDTWQHANSKYQAWDSGGFSSLQVLSLPRGALMTFLYGCHSADFWTAPGTTPFNVNIAVSYVFGRSICQAATGTSWSYGTEFKYLVYEAMRDDYTYLGNAWFAMESYVETSAFVELRYPERDPHTECAGNTLLGNPFLLVNGAP